MKLLAFRARVVSGWNGVAPTVYAVARIGLMLLGGFYLFKGEFARAAADFALVAVSKLYDIHRCLEDGAL